MATLTFDPSDENVSTAQQKADEAALAQGEVLEQARNEDRQNKLQQAMTEQENLSLIGGKFKSQEDLLKAYQELEKKISQPTEGDRETPTEQTTDTPTEEQSEEVETTEVDKVILKASEAYEQDGQLSSETIEQLSKLDSRELIESYVKFYSQSQQQLQAQQIQTAELTDIQNMAGGPDGYNEMIQWAADNLPSTEIDAFNSVTASANVPAIKFAVESLSNKWKNAEGYEGTLVKGNRSVNDGLRPYRSNAELAADINNPRYQNDPAFRQDVEKRLSRSKDLL